MHHRMRNFHSSRKPVENHTADFVFENRDQVGKVPQVLFGTMDRRREVTF